MKKVILKIEGMSCSACSNTIEKYLNKQEGVNAIVNLVMANALIYYDENKVNIEDLNKYIEESGYKSLGIYNEKEEQKKDNSRIYLIIFGIIVIILMLSSFLKNSIITFILTIPFIIYGLDIIKSGIKKIISKSPNMDTLVSIGVLSSFIYSTANLIGIFLGNKNLINHLYFESSAMIIYFIKLGKYIDKSSKEKAKEAIKELVTITPEKALLKTTNGEKEITIDEVKKGDILIVKPGMKVAVDGTIIEGKSHFDEAFITGESLPSKKKENDKVIAGSMNLDGYIEYKAERIGPESTISEIVRLVTEAINTKAPIGKLADTISSYFVPIIILISLLTLTINLLSGNTFNNSIISFVTVLLVACPCALGLATPIAMVVSIGTFAKNGILIKRNEILEIINKLDTIVFDKTGTLTYGKLSISKIYNYSKEKDEELLKIISSLEKKSTHPIAKTFTSIKTNKKCTNFKNIEGIGIYGEIDKKQIYIGNNKVLKKLNINNPYKKEELELSNQGNSIIYVVEDKKIISLIGIKDTIRENAIKTIDKLKNMNKDIILLSGDNEITANIVANELGINQVYANVMPKDKKDKLEDLRKKHKVMMIGDGINDAPALANSDIGVSISGGTDIALDSSDIILMKDDLEKIVTLFEFSNKTIRIIKENLFWAFLYNSLMIPIAIGLLKQLNLSISPMLASIAMTISSLTVILNSLRLKKI